MALTERVKAILSAVAPRVTRGKSPQRTIGGDAGNRTRVRYFERESSADAY